jgi:hypothetical protein
MEERSNAFAFDTQPFRKQRERMGHPSDGDAEWGGYTGGIILLNAACGPDTIRADLRAFQELL